MNQSIAFNWSAAAFADRFPHSLENGGESAKRVERNERQRGRD